MSAATWRRRSAADYSSGLARRAARTVSPELTTLWPSRKVLPCRYRTGDQGNQLTRLQPGISSSLSAGPVSFEDTSEARIRLKAPAGPAPSLSQIAGDGAALWEDVRDRLLALPYVHPASGPADALD
jgi:hypothetical protein